MVFHIKHTLTTLVCTEMESNPSLVEVRGCDDEVNINFLADSLVRRSTHINLKAPLWV